MGGCYPTSNADLLTGYVYIFFGGKSSLLQILKHAKLRDLPLRGKRLHVHQKDQEPESSSYRRLCKEPVCDLAPSQPSPQNQTEMVVPTKALRGASCAENCSPWAQVEDSELLKNCLCTETLELGFKGTGSLT